MENTLEVQQGIVGFSVIAATAIGNEFSLKWGKYKLTLPVKRTDIVRSLFLNQIFGLSLELFLPVLHQVYPI